MLKKMIIYIGIKNIQDNYLNYMDNIVNIVKRILLIFYKIIYNLVLFLILLLFLSSKFGIIIGPLLATLIFIIYILIKNRLIKYIGFRIVEKILQIIVFFIIFMLINNIFVFYYNTYNYDKFTDIELKDKISISNDVSGMLCIQDIFNESLLSYKYHTPKSNPILPTLGTRYKTMYKEERGIIVVYEKRSYLNLYVGDGRILCNEKDNYNLETLE